MGKKIAIKGHTTRGEEVIKLLEMMGGNDSNAFRCNNPNLIYYVLDNHTRWDYIAPEEIDEYNIFTLEEFLEKFPFKVGDFVNIPEYESEVRILKMKWCPLSEHIEYLVYPNDEEEWFTADELLEDNDNPNKMSDCKKCGLNFGSVRCFDKDCPHNTPKSYAVGLKDGKVIDNLIHKDIDMNTCKDTAREAHKKIAYLSINNEDYADQIEINLGDNYEYKFEMNRLYILKKKPKYPKNYKKCCQIVGGIASERHLQYDTIPSYKFEEDLRDSLETLRKLIICRKAYWKIAGEEMSLGKPWEPDWSTEDEIKYVIEVYCNNVRKNSQGYSNTILSFPTAEMRDVFYENFKELIEQCKEWL